METLKREELIIPVKEIPKDGIVWLHNEVEGICSSCEHFRKLYYALVLPKSKKVMVVECADCFAEHY